MAFCIKPLVRINDKEIQLIKENNYQKFISWKWFSKKKIVNKLLVNESVELYPCGSCLNCINMKRFHWVSKLSAEKNNWLNTYFITLTYSDDNLPNELRVSDIQKFMKYLRSELKDKVKYFCCGEYGTKTQRPHYHLILFTNKTLELEFLKYTPTGPLYDCKLLNKCWKQKGYIWVAYDFDNLSFAYVSSYSNKSFLKQKQTLIKKEFEKNKYELSKEYSGFKLYLEIEKLIPNILFKKNEFIIMSKKPPIGSNSQDLKKLPSSLLKWKDKQYLNSFKDYNLNNTILNNPYYKELKRRYDEYIEFLKNNNLYDIIKTDEILHNKKSVDKMKGII